MFEASFWQTLPDPLRQPATLGLLASFLAHGLFFAVFPMLTTSETPDDKNQRTVRVVQLTPEEQSRSPQGATSSQVPLPPLKKSPSSSLLPPSTGIPNSFPNPFNYKIPTFTLPNTPVIPAPTTYDWLRESFPPRQRTLPPPPSPQPPTSTPINSPSPTPTSTSSPIPGTPPSASPTPQPTPTKLSSALEYNRELREGLAYNATGTTEQEHTYNYGTWFEENITKKLGSISDNQLDAKTIDLTVPYPTNLPILKDYTPALIPVLVDPQGKIVTDITKLELLRKTGYPTLDKIAQEILKVNLEKTEKPPFTATGKYVIYQFKLTFEAPKPETPPT